MKIEKKQWIVETDPYDFGIARLYNLSIVDVTNLYHSKSYIQLNQFASKFCGFISS